MSNLAERYDFELFGNAAPDIQPVEEPRPQRPRPVRLPKKEQRTRPRIKRNWAQIFAWSFVFVSITGIAGLRVEKEVELTMLTDQIQTVQSQLDEARAEEVQLRMKADTIINKTGLEAYAKNKLGMQPIRRDQAVYFNGERSDKGVVYAPTGETDVPLWERIVEFLDRIFQ